MKVKSPEPRAVRKGRASVPMLVMAWLVLCAITGGARQVAAQMRIPLEAKHGRTLIHGSDSHVSGLVWGGWAFDGFSRDSRLFAISRDASIVELWDLQSGQRAFALEHPSHASDDVWLSGLHFPRDGRTLAACFVSIGKRAAEENEVMLFDLAKREPRASIRLGRNVHCRSIAFSPDAATAVLARSSTPVRPTKTFTKSRDEVVVFNAATGEEVKRLDTVQSCHAIEFSPDGKWLATARFISYEKGQVLLWDAATFERRSTLRAGGGWLNLAFSPDSKLLATAANRHWKIAGPAPGVRLWDVEKGKERGWLDGYDAGARSPAAVYPLFAPQGGFLVAGCYGAPPGETRFKLWNTATGEQSVLDRCEPEGYMEVTGEGYGRPAFAAFSPDGSILATPEPGVPPAVKLWETKYWRPLRTLPLRGHDGASPPVSFVRRIQFSPDGKWLAAIGLVNLRNKGEVVIWNLSEVLPASPDSHTEISK